MLVEPPLHPNIEGKPQPGDIVACLICRGTGKHLSGDKDCPRCQGTGQAVIIRAHCPVCHGCGTIAPQGRPCHICHSTGWICKVH